MACVFRVPTLARMNESAARRRQATAAAVTAGPVCQVFGPAARIAARSRRREWEAKLASNDLHCLAMQGDTFDCVVQ